ncbi:acyl-CoA dehydrogenase [Nocardia rhizosphaerihabitans]|uniref:Acyl-CoA dehydrogenase n=1 Tax=Nocardia rhizosphaerihabitans TaxID=1691570 RepID=A0ABQ2KZ55_9NOCA|nr:acyl-CoA dehydrogenase [Nocardia rhizosphaerihabitans]
MTEHSGLDSAERALFTETIRRAMSAATGQALDIALPELGWPDLLDAAPELVGPVMFRLLGETGAHAPLLLDVLGHAGADPCALPFTGGHWVRWERHESGGDEQTTRSPGDTIDAELPLRRVPDGAVLTARALSEGRRALGWWLLGTGHAMLGLARAHALERVQFGRPLASFQAVRHRLAETLVALDGAEAALLVADEVALDRVPGNPASAALLAKAAAGHAALTASRHCQQVLGGIGFTAEHPHHRHVRRTLVLDGLLGSARDLTREAGAAIRASGTAARIAHL